MFLGNPCLLKKTGWAVFVLILASFQMGTIRKKEDPILKTQTSPIALNDKIEEIQNGPKGAPTPSFKLYTQSGFLTDPPVAQGKSTPEAPNPADLSKKVTEVPGIEQKERNSQEDWWLEDQGKDEGEDDLFEEEDEESEESQTNVK